ncbi:MAG: 4Fe-4S binding protein [Lentisphaerae bacterium]|nr:4Fe-4S binding protein [Lentisphaerota bacterium]
MKIAVTAKGRTLDDQVDPRFGRCSYFLVIDAETLDVKPLENPNLALGGGAGIQSAQLMAEHEVKAVLTGNCGPNAYQTLKAADIEVIVGASGTVREAIGKFKAGGLSSTQGPNVASHFGMGAGTEGSGAQTSTPPMDSSMGRGMGGGRGMGRGMGMGGGRGMGRGMGMGGGGRGMGPGMGVAPGAEEFPPVPASAGEADVLRAEAQNLEAQLQTINSRIGQLASGRARLRLLAAVDAGKCTACGLCEKVCPEQAITVEKIAVISAAKCTGCGQCVAECPQDALTLKKG